MKKLKPCIYKFMKDKDVRVGVHCHDKKKIYKQIHPRRNWNAQPKWYLALCKGNENSNKKISSRPQYSKEKYGLFSSFLLSNKLQQVAAHVHWCIRNCNQHKYNMLKSPNVNVDHKYTSVSHLNDIRNQ